MKKKKNKKIERQKEGLNSIRENEIEIESGLSNEEKNGKTQEYKKEKEEE